jgi:hypothetical protein
MHLAVSEVEIDAVIRDDPWKPLRDPTKLQDGGPFHAGRFYAGRRTAVKKGGPEGPPLELTP